jgi:hypothetical protein
VRLSRVRVDPLAIGVVTCVCNSSSRWKGIVMNDERLGHRYQDTSDNPDEHYSVLTNLVSTLLTDGREAMADAWNARQAYWPSRPIDSAIRTAELKTFSAAAKT